MPGLLASERSGKSAEKCVTSRFRECQSRRCALTAMGLADAVPHFPLRSHFQVALTNNLRKQFRWISELAQIDFDSWNIQLRKINLKFTDAKVT